MKKIAVFPGSFDPITLGHVDIINRVQSLFDKLIIAIGENAAKKNMFPLESRVEMIRKILRGSPKIEIVVYRGLTIDFCRQVKAGFLVRGLRSNADFDYEKTIAQLNHSMDSGIETIFLVSRPEFSHISSTIVREILFHKGDVSKFVPPGIIHDLKKSTS